jgi:predicted kinase
VVLDATFRTRDERTAVMDNARARRCSIWVVECQLPQSVALSRIAQRQTSGEGASDADAETYLAQRSRYEPITPSEGRYLIADTSKPISSVVSRILASIVRSFATGSNIERDSDPF